MHKINSALCFFACRLLLAGAICSPAQAHDVGDNIQPLSLVGYGAPFGVGATTYTDVWGSGDLAMIGSLESGVAILSLGEPGPVPHLGTFSPTIPREFRDVKADGGYGYFSSSDGGGTFVVDLADPNAPAEVFQINSAVGGHDNVRNATLGNGYLYQMDETSSLIHVFDVTSPTQPQFVRTVDTGDSVGIHDATLIGDRLYTSGLGGDSGEGAVYIYDVTDIGSTSPLLVAQVPSGANTSSAWPTSDEQYVVVTHRELGGSLGIWDISDPSQPTLASSADASDLAIDSYSSAEVVLLDDYLYVAWWQAGVQMLDLDNDLVTNGVQLIGQYDTSTDSNPLQGFVGNASVYPLLGHDRVLLSDSKWGFFAVDATGSIPNGGDFDGDGNVDGMDFLAWQQGFGTSTGALASDGDANVDGKVDGADLLIWEENFGLQSSAASFDAVAVPEPSSRMILGLAGGVFLLRYRFWGLAQTH